MALQNFLCLLINLRVVIFQDAAILFLWYPALSIFKFKPFSSECFRVFTLSAVSVVALAEAAAHQHYQNLSEHFAESLHGVMKTSEINRKQTKNTMLQHIEDLNNSVCSLLLMQKGSKGKVSPLHEYFFSVG